MPKYSIFIQYDSSDDIFVAEIPELPGCMAHGDTPEKAMQEILIAQNLWLDAAKENGIEIPAPALYVN